MDLYRFHDADYEEPTDVPVMHGRYVYDDATDKWHWEES